MTDNDMYMVIRRAVTNWYAKNQEIYDLCDCDNTLLLLSKMYLIYCNDREDKV